MHHFYRKLLCTYMQYVLYYIVMGECTPTKPCFMPSRIFSFSLLITHPGFIVRNVSFLTVYPWLSWILHDYKQLACFSHKGTQFFFFFDDPVFLFLLKSVLAHSFFSPQFEQSREVLEPLLCFMAVCLLHWEKFKCYSCPQIKSCGEIFQW